MLTPPMVPTQNGMHLTQSDEGCELKAYQDVGGTWTIAWGHTPAYKGQTCTLIQAEEWLKSDYQIAADAINCVVDVPLTQAEFDALCDFVFNLGRGNFDGSTLLKTLNSGDYQGAAAQFDLWDHCGGKVVAGLLRRRQQETSEFEGQKVNA